MPVEETNLRAGDLVFRSGYHDCFLGNEQEGIGHVGLATGEGTVIHATNHRVGVSEVSLNSFSSSGRFRGIRRYIPDERDIITLLIPDEWEIETSDDLRWLIHYRQQRKLSTRPR